MSSFLGEKLPEVPPPLEESAPERGAAQRIPNAILRIPVSVQIVIGTAKLTLSQVADLKPGAMIPLEEKLGSSARLLVNGREVAMGDLYVLDGEGDRLGLTITEVAETNATSP